MNGALQVQVEQRMTSWREGGVEGKGN